ncbi:MAG: hypothetical protein IKR71_08155, partial [Bacteroidales bacterium]|nr:hypothetical protein [Bacteroidales bacterium]
IFKEADGQLRALRLQLSQWVGIAIKNGMSLLGIDVPDKM